MLSKRWKAAGGQEPYSICSTYHVGCKIRQITAEHIVCAHDLTSAQHSEEGKRTGNFATRLVAPERRLTRYRDDLSHEQKSVVRGEKSSCVQGGVFNITSWRPTLSLPTFTSAASSSCKTCNTAPARSSFLKTDVWYVCTSVAWNRDEGHYRTLSSTEKNIIAMIPKA